MNFLLVFHLPLPLSTSSIWFLSFDEGNHVLFVVHWPLIPFCVGREAEKRQEDWVREGFASFLGLVLNWIGMAFI